jgi:hypothetical protein
MVEYGQGPRSGSRDNGLRCANYVMVGDLDPRIADSLLETLREEGIAAYVTPTPSSQGGFLETRRPSKMTDRLYADAERTERAHELLPAPDPTGDIDFDSAWQQVLQSLQSPTDGTTTSWPSSEDMPAPSATREVPIELPTSDYRGYEGDPALDEHFEPPPPPPLPRLRRVTIIALIAIAAGIAILATNFDNGSLMWLAIVSIVSGVATLIWHMKDGPPIDSGWDDGAVV